MRVTRVIGYVVWFTKPGPARPKMPLQESIVRLETLSHCRGIGHSVFAVTSTDNHDRRQSIDHITRNRIPS